MWFDWEYELVQYGIEEEELSLKSVLIRVAEAAGTVAFCLADGAYVSQMRSRSPEYIKKCQDIERAAITGGAIVTLAGNSYRLYKNGPPLIRAIKCLREEKVFFHKYEQVYKTETRIILLKD